MQDEELQYYENGAIKEKLNYRDGLAHGTNIIYSVNGDIEEVGQFYNGIAIGYFTKYHRNHLYHIRQYVIIGNDSYVNQYWGFDESGNLDENYSNYYSLNVNNRDTLKLNEEVTINIKLEVPYYKEGKMELIIGNFDDFYNLTDSSTLKSIKCKNFAGTFSTKFDKPGKNYVRGFIKNLKNKNENNKLFTYERDIYFMKRFIVESPH